MVSAVQDLQDPRRVEPTYLLGERDMLEGWLEFHRTTLLLKCEGLDDAARKSRPVPTSLLSLHGLVRHMAEVERSWFRRCLLREPDLPYIYCTGTQDWDDQDLVPLDDADWATDLAIWKAECEASREPLRATASTTPASVAAKPFPSVGYTPTWSRNMPATMATQTSSAN